MIPTHDTLFQSLNHFTQCRRVRNSEVCALHPTSVAIGTALEGIQLTAFESRSLERLRDRMPVGAVATPKVILGYCRACQAEFSLAAVDVEFTFGADVRKRVYELTEREASDVVFRSRVTNAMIDDTHALWVSYARRWASDRSVFDKVTAPVDVAPGSPHWESIDWTKLRAPPRVTGNVVFGSTGGIVGLP